MREMRWQQAVVSLCETHHIFNHIPMYTQRFETVMKYHAPGLASVKDLAGAFHIDIDGQPAYSMRFVETFGFYEGLAAVRSAEGCLHIKADGTEAYSVRYLWCGNFQEGHCPVR